ncbi:MAG: hypothetical protein KDH88_09860 [Chromatiales bacterium]|nr:hypothetical protein [Chromatiales bacterium]
MHTKPATFTKVSEWIAAGNMACGFYCFESPVRETDKAIGIQAQKFNAAANLKPATCWFPRSQIQEVENDYYTNGPVTMFLVPRWLYDRKVAEGYTL